MTSDVHCSALCELLPWDSQFFHCRIAKVRSDTLTDEEATEVEEWVMAERVSGLYFLARADCPASIQIAQNHGFALVDIRVTMEYEVANCGGRANGQANSSPVIIRPARAEDLAELQSIARTAHVDSRFFSDSHFPRHLAEELYRTWIRLECEGRAQCVLVAISAADKALGYVSCHFDKKTRSGQIGLSGVSHEARGRGIGKNLVNAALEWFDRRGADKVIVATQGKNIAAQRLYQRCGFVIQDLQLWYHKWFHTPAATDGR